MAALIITVTAGAAAAPSIIEASPVDRIQDQARALANGAASSNSLVLDSGRPAFRLSPNNGYVGLETEMIIAPSYVSYQNGGQVTEAIVEAHIDWGDGNISTTPGNSSVSHTYGHRADSGAITPNRSRVFNGQITFVVSNGRRYTEAFTYSMWNDRFNAQRQGGRDLPIYMLPNVDGVGGGSLPGGFYNRNNR
jgi:hypothetical protein|tara:strand:+ start:3136 stop:3714 length:579 start_codon:yes stop_codon:yes gene_type:complete